jgi:hypothetical protein
MGVEELKRDLQECKDEVPKMEQMEREMDEIINKNIVSGEILNTIKTQRAQLIKDLENYKHMLEEADDLKKSWEKE